MKFNTKQAKNPIELNIEFDNGAQYCRSEIKLGKIYEFAICMRNAITR